MDMGCHAIEFFRWLLGRESRKARIVGAYLVVFALSGIGMSYLMLERYVEALDWGEKALPARDGQMPRRALPRAARPARPSRPCLALPASARFRVRRHW